MALFFDYILVAALFLPGLAQARSILVVAPHPDDEALIAAGIIETAVSKGDEIHVALMTNGDYYGKAMGYRRMQESVAAMRALGLPERKVIFLGYGDASLDLLWKSGMDDQVIPSRAEQTHTYANRGFGKRDYHRLTFGQSATYTRANVLIDLQTLLLALRPDDIYTTVEVDKHPDHHATHLFLREAIARLQHQSLPDYHPTLHLALVHAPGEPHWPAPAYSPHDPVPAPSQLTGTEYPWDQTEQIPVPPSMLHPEFWLNRKARVIRKYLSQLTPWLFSFVKPEETFWVRGT